MTGPQFSPFLPTYIPQDVDISAVQAQVAADDVSAPAALQPGLRGVIADAQRDGIELKIVVIDHNPPNDTPLRDIATVVGQANPGATVLVLSPSYTGTYSAHFDRVELEAGEDLAKTGDPVQSSTNFVSQLNTGVFPFTALTIVLTIGVILTVVLLRFVQIKSKPDTATATPSTSQD
jgi:hypothetical protein